jgi:hypothetical protein
MDDNGFGELGPEALQPFGRTRIEVELTRTQLL